MSIIEQIRERHRSFHANIARKAAEVERSERYKPLARSFEIPNETYGVPKVRPFRVEAVEFYYRNMWFYDLVFQSARETRKLDIRLIQEMTCKHYRVRMDEMLSRQQSGNIVWPRHVAMYFAKTLTVQSLAEIGRRFGGRDHTTVMSAVRKVGRLAATDAKLKANLEDLERMMRGAR